MSKLGDAIKALPLKRERAACPEWEQATGQDLYVRELTGDERLDNEKYQMQQAVDSEGEVDRKKLAGAFSDIRKRVIVQALVDESGEPVFENVAELKGVSGEVVGRLSDQIMQLNGLAGDAVEQAAGNSGTSQPDASG